MSCGDDQGVNMHAIDKTRIAGHLICGPSRFVVSVILTIGLMLSFVPGSGIATPSAPLQVYRYDFESGTDDWSLQSGIWTLVPVDGGHALKGDGHGHANLTAHAGEVSSL